MVGVDDVTVRVEAVEAVAGVLHEQPEEFGVLLYRHVLAKRTPDLLDEESPLVRVTRLLHERAGALDQVIVQGCGVRLGDSDERTPRRNRLESPEEPIRPIERFGCDDETVHVPRPKDVLGRCPRGHRPWPNAGGHSRCLERVRNRATRVEHQDGGVVALATLVLFHSSECEPFNINGPASPG